MGAIKLKGFAKEGKLTIAVPEEFNGQEVEVTIERRYANDSIQNDSEHEERVKRLMSIVGTAKYPDFPMTKYDVYDK